MMTLGFKARPSTLSPDPGDLQHRRAPHGLLAAGGEAGVQLRQVAVPQGQAGRQVPSLRSRLPLQSRFPQR